MGRMVVTELISVDGVVEAPTGTEGFERVDWTGRFRPRSGGRPVQVGRDDGLRRAAARATSPTRASRRHGRPARASSRTSSTRCPSTSSRPRSRTPSGTTRPWSPATSPKRSPSSSGGTSATSSCTAARNASAIVRAGPSREAKDRPGCIDFLAAVLAEQRSHGRMVTLDDVAPAGVAWFGGLLCRAHDVREEAVASTRSSSALLLPAVGYSRSDVSTLAADGSDGG
jgi:hypothetical protein